MLEEDESGGEATGGQALRHGRGGGDVGYEAAVLLRSVEPIEARIGESVQVGAREQVRGVRLQGVWEEQRLSDVLRGIDDGGHEGRVASGPLVIARPSAVGD
jgi:hypothetical protein